MELDCGIKLERITDWLDNELALSHEGDYWAFAHAGATCRVCASSLENRKISGLNIERTLVTIDGDDEAVDEFYRLFTLRFVSAGG